MRRDHRPYWLKSLWDRLTQSYVDHFVRPQFESTGRDFRVMYPRSLQVSGSGISAGDHVHIMALPDSWVRLSVFESMGRIHIGDYSIVNPGVRITSASDITLGKSCMLAMNAYLSDADWHDIRHRIFSPGATAPITLGDNVWIGDSALVCKGVTIGDNSLVGAWSVVTHDVPANTVVVGNPARTVRALDPEELTTRQALFTGAQSYEEFESNYFAQRLQGNGLPDYLRTLIAPNSLD